MNTFSKVIGWLLFPIKFCFELMDPILRYFELAINLPFMLLSIIVNVINDIPSIWKIHLGELVLAILSGVGFFMADKYLIHLSINQFLLVSMCIGIGLVSYFAFYLIFKFVVNFITSTISIIVVLIRVSIYLPGSILMTLLKIILSFAIWSVTFFTNYEYFTQSLEHNILCILLLLLIMNLISIAIIFIRNDIEKYDYLGTLSEISLDKLKTYTHSIGLYIMTFHSIPVYVGRAIEFKNGGIRKRIRDYQRSSNSHTSGEWIQNHMEDLEVHVLVLGHTENDVGNVIDAEASMISNIYTKLNKVDSSLNYLVNFLGYFLSGIASCITVYIFLGKDTLSYGIMGYFGMVFFISVFLYIFENNKKWS